MTAIRLTQARRLRAPRGASGWIVAAGGFGAETFQVALAGRLSLAGRLGRLALAGPAGAGWSAGGYARRTAVGVDARGADCATGRGAGAVAVGGGVSRGGVSWRGALAGPGDGRLKVLLDAIAKVLREPPLARGVASGHEWPYRCRGACVGSGRCTSTWSRPARRSRTGCLVIRRCSWRGSMSSGCMRSLNGVGLAPSIVVRGVDVAPPSFDARFSASWRRYRYSDVEHAVAGDPVPGTGIAWHVERTARPVGDAVSRPVMRSSASTTLRRSVKGARSVRDARGHYRCGS